MRDGRGVVVALPHAGNWDHAGAYFCAMGFPLVTVVEKLKPEALFNKFLESSNLLASSNNYNLLIFL